MLKYSIGIAALLASTSLHAQSVVVNGSQAFNPTTSGIVGTTTNNNASSGILGEFLSSNVPAASAVGLTSGTVANVTSLTLTPGDWDVRGWIALNPAGSTTQTLVIGGVSPTSGAFAVASPTGGSNITQDYSVPAGIGEAFVVPESRFTLASTTTVYLLIQNYFAGGANSAYGYIAARRAR